MSIDDLHQDFQKFHLEDRAGLERNANVAIIREEARVVVAKGDKAKWLGQDWSRPRSTNRKLTSGIRLTDFIME